MNNLIEFKTEMTKLCDQLKNKLQRKKTKEVYLKESLEYKE